ncbi:substrate-binding domain-containing protein [Cerasicoccus arenae]|uniref:HTH araC/xylS-type domain-containing protein n=1 Tax=Cerasicoccus arenae TaxID=424488 RepID=A0A8J3D8V7_9BACT|nr:substrate-binding domain-containing protein [Cerasicoccus arenae]MBK1857010.1 substrate-binding domain-containing protein [Cerasicoccus arenae]GHB90360.1 hypothetical protein GCM10007047_01350 [Cerasicoccus arenae]
MSDVFVRRLAPGLAPLVVAGRDFWTVDVLRPISELKQILRKWAPQGIITESLPRVTKALVELDLPTVIVDSDVCYPGVVSLDVDDYAIGVRAANHLHQAGHQSFACYLNRTPYAEQRGRGFIERLETLGFSCKIYRQQQHEAKHYAEHWLHQEASFTVWLNGLPKPTALFAAHDPMGRAVCEIARSEGISVPESLSVLAVNNDEIICSLSSPPLSSIAAPWEALAQQSVFWLERVISGAPPPTEPILTPPGEVVDRQSTSLLAIDDPLLAKAIQIIREEASQGLGVKELTDMLGVNRRTLERRFQERLQRSPRAEIMRVRMCEARRLLAETDLSMPWIAERCGFSNAERFCVAFHLHEAKTPTQFRTSVRRGT